MPIEFQIYDWSSDHEKSDEDYSDSEDEPSSKYIIHVLEDVRMENLFI